MDCFSYYTIIGWGVYSSKHGQCSAESHDDGFNHPRGSVPFVPATVTSCVKSAEPFRGPSGRSTLPTCPHKSVLLENKRSVWRVLFITCVYPSGYVYIVYLTLFFLCLCLNLHLIVNFV